jgi:hypothetical protein
MTFPIYPFGRAAQATSLVVGLAPSIVLLILARSHAPQGLTILLVGIPIALVVAVAGLFATIAWAGRHGYFEVETADLRLRMSIYGRRVPLDALRLEDARIVDLTVDEQLQTQLRTNGVGLPGYCEGWHRLRNGDRALVMVTDKRRVVYIPTTERYDLLLSPADGEAMLAELRRRRPPGENRE